MKIEFKPIGIVHSPFKSVRDVLRDCRSIIGEIEVFKECELGLESIDGVSHL